MRFLRDVEEVDLCLWSPEVDVCKRFSEVGVSKRSPEVDVCLRSPEVDVCLPSPEVDVCLRSAEVDVCLWSPEVDVCLWSAEVDVCLEVEVCLRSPRDVEGAWCFDLARCEDDDVDALAFAFFARRGGGGGGGGGGREQQPAVEAAHDTAGVGHEDISATARAQGFECGGDPSHIDTWPPYDAAATQLDPETFGSASCSAVGRPRRVVVSCYIADLLNIDLIGPCHSLSGSLALCLSLVSLCLSRP